MLFNDYFTYRGVDMSIIQALKDLIGYTADDLNDVFAVIAMIIVIYFLFSLFNILVSLFKK